LHPKVAIKSIVIALIDRLAAYAAREAENESPEERVRQEEEAARRLVGEVKKQRARERAKQDGVETGAINVDGEETEGWGAVVDVGGNEGPKDDGLIDGQVPTAVPGQEKPVRKFRGIPEDVKLFEVFWGQIVELIKVRLS
jgi:vacuolar protein sorting-associated protein 35